MNWEDAVRSVCDRCGAPEVADRDALRETLGSRIRWVCLSGHSRWATVGSTPVPEPPRPPATRGHLRAVKPRATHARHGKSLRRKGGRHAARR